MSRTDKLAQKLRNNPSNFLWTDLVTLLTRLKFTEQKHGKTGGARRKFFHEGKECLISLHEPHPEKEIDTGAAVAVLETLEKNGFI